MHRTHVQLSCFHQSKDEKSPKRLFCFIYSQPNSTSYTHIKNPENLTKSRRQRLQKEAEESLGFVQSWRYENWAVRAAIDTVISRSYTQDGSCEGGADGLGERVI